MGKGDPSMASRLNDFTPCSFSFNESLDRIFRAIPVPHLRPRIEPKHAQFLVAATRLGDPSRPGNRLLASR